MSRFGLPANDDVRDDRARQTLERHEQAESTVDAGYTPP